MVPSPKQSVDKTGDTKTKIAAVISIGIQLFVFVSGILSFFQTRYVLLSPLIPEGTVNDIAFPYLLSAVISLPFIVVSIILFRKGIFKLPIFLGVVVLVTQYVVLEL
jgi:hypothetical protein